MHTRESESNVLSCFFILLVLLIPDSISAHTPYQTDQPNGPLATVEPLEGSTHELATGVRLFRDRDYIARDVPEEIAGVPFIRSPLTATRLICRKPGRVMAVTSVADDPHSRAAELERMGFKRTSIPEFRLIGRPDAATAEATLKQRIPVSLEDWETKCVLWQKHLILDERIELPSEVSFVTKPRAPWCVFLAHLDKPESKQDQRSSFSPTLAMDYTVAAQVPDPRRYFVHDPGLCVLPTGTLIVASPIWGRGRRSGLTSEPRLSGPQYLHMSRSRDGGKSWERLADLPYAEGTPFFIKGELYMFTQPRQHKNVYFMRSRDEGTTWEGPVKVLEGNFWNCQTSMVQRGDTLYWVLDEIHQALLVIAADLTKDLLDPAAWRRSPIIKAPGLPQALRRRMTAVPPDQSEWLLEANVMLVGDELMAVCRVNPAGDVGNVAAIWSIEDKDGNLSLTFENYHPWPGAYTKFCIVRDETSRLFWMTSNLSMGYDPKRFGVGDAPASRRALMLSCSSDGLAWLPVGCVAMAPTSTQSFMYPSMHIDGDDLVIISRTGRHADSYHDADMSTFHRVTDFRSLSWH